MSACRRSQHFERVGLRPVKLQGRDALALVNGTSLTAAAAALAVSTARRAVSVALGLSALLVETLGGAVGFHVSGSAGALGTPVGPPSGHCSWRKCSAVPPRSQADHFKKRTACGVCRSSSGLRRKPLPTLSRSLSRTSTA